MDKYREERAEEDWFSIPRYNRSLSTCIPKMSILPCMVVEKSLTKNSSKYGRKENWTNNGMNKQEKAGSQSNDTISRHQPAYQI